MSLDVRGIINGLTSHASASGMFDSVNGHEPKGAPGGGLTFSVWVREVAPILSSGLSSTSVRVVFTARLYKPFTSQPEDSIDPDMVGALDVLMDAYAGDFTLGDEARAVDILGSDGPSLSVQTGYLEVDRSLYRIVDITLPILINDVWEQVS